MSRHGPDFTQQVTLEWNEEAIEHYNDLILNEIDSQLAQAKVELTA